jgi:hypothetical protein
MKSLQSILIAGMVMFTAHSSMAAEFFTDHGSYWLGGEASFSTAGYSGENSRINFLSVTPIVRFFPAKSFFVGPALSWKGAFEENYSTNVFGLGVDLGFAFGEKHSVVPYFRSGGQFDIYAYSESSNNYDGYDNSYHYHENGFTLPIAGGVIIPLFDVIALQIEPSFTLNWIDGESFNTFGISFGFCGKGTRSAISILNGINIRDLYF